MDFEFSESERAVVNLVRKVAQEKFRPTAFEKRLDTKAPIENLKILADLGLLGLCLPEEYGGSGRPYVEAILAIEELGAACPVTTSYALMSMAGPPDFIATWGTASQKQRYLPGAISGDARFSISLTEPEAGSALTDLRTSAEIVGDRVIVNGAKTFCSRATSSHYFLVFVRFRPGSAGIGAIIVSRDTPGFSMSSEHTFMNGSPWAELYFDNAEVPVEDVLSAGDEFGKLMSSYSAERCASAAQVLGFARLAMEMSVDYVKQRQQFGRPISDFQFVQGKLADMYLALEQARLLLYRAVTTTSNGYPDRLGSSAARVAAVNAACLVTDEAMQLHGAGGMSTEMPLEWLYRCVRPHKVAGGTLEIHRSVIAQELVGRRINQRR